MTRILALASATVAVVALSLSPAVAMSKKHQHRHGGYEQSHRADSYNGWNQGMQGGWNNRTVSGNDPSFGNRGAITRAQSTGRCVEDLGYGRYEYCGW